MTACQAFRWGTRAWGLVFHVEADPALVESWVHQQSMRVEAATVDPTLPGRMLREAPNHVTRLAELQAAVVDGLLTPSGVA